MSIDVIDTTNEINNLFKKAKVYAEENDIEYIVIFAKGIKNVLNLNNLLKGSGIRLLVTTFPSNQVLYLENEEGVIEEESTTDRLNITKEFVSPIKCSIDNFSKNNQRLFTYNQIIKNTPQTWGVFFII